MRIKIEFQGPGFVAVPNHVAAMVADGLLSASALGCLVVMALRPVGSEWSVSAIQKACGVGDFAWRRIAKELRLVKAFEADDLERGAGGKLAGRVWVVRWPEKAVKVGKPQRGKPTCASVVKPRRGKPTLRLAQVIEIVEQTEVIHNENEVRLNTKTGEAVASHSAKAASPVVNSEIADRWNRAAISAGMGLRWVHPVTGKWMDAEALASLALGCASGADAERARSAMSEASGGVVPLQDLKGHWDGSE